MVPEKVPEKVEIFGELCGYFGQFRRLRDKFAGRARVARDEMGRGGGGLNQEAPTRAGKHVMFWLQLQALFLINATFHHHAAAGMFYM